MTNDEEGRVRPTQHSALSTPHSYERLRAAALFLVFLGFYLLTVSGHFYTVDEETLYLMTENLVERQNLALPPDSWGVVGEFGLTIAPNSTAGPIEAIFTPGQPIAAIPLYLLGRAVATLFPAADQGYITRFFVGLFGSVITAATVALLYRCARTLGYRGRASLGLAAIYGLATTAWPHGRTFLAEPLTALLLLVAFYGLVKAEGGMRNAEFERPMAGTTDSPPPLIPRSAFRVPPSLLVSGAGAVAALLVKPHAVIALPPLGCYLLWVAARRWRADRRAALGLLGAWAAGGAIPLAGFALFNLWLYGTPLRVGYGNWPLALFNTPFLTGLYGLTLSSGKGLLWYAPPIALALAGAWPFFRRRRAEALVCFAIAAIHLLFYSRLRFWHGDWIWGPRFLLIALPFAMLPLVACLEGLRARRARFALVMMVVLAGLFVATLGAVVNFAAPIVRSQDADARFFSPAASPLLAHARMLSARVLAWRGQTFPQRDTALLAAGFDRGEAAGETLFPRWTTGNGDISLWPAARAPLTVKLTFFDHRPLALRAAPPTLLLNGAPFSDPIERYDFSGTGEGWTYSFVVPATALGARGATVTLQNMPWNPRALGLGERDEDLGVFVHNVEVWRDGQPLTVGRARTIPPMPATMPERHWWFNDDRAADSSDPDAPAPHLVDWWAWYVAEAGWSPALTHAWIAAYAGSAALILATGALLGWRASPRPLPRRVKVPPRRSRRARAPIRPVA